MHLVQYGYEGVGTLTDPAMLRKVSGNAVKVYLYVFDEALRSNRTVPGPSSVTDELGRKTGLFTIKSLAEMEEELHIDTDLLRVALGELDRVRWADVYVDDQWPDYYWVVVGKEHHCDYSGFLGVDFYINREEA